MAGLYVITYFGFGQYSIWGFLVLTRPWSRQKQHPAFEPSIPRINSETNPLHPFSMLFASIWDSFLAQASVLLLCQYTATLSRGRGLIYFCKVDHSRISRKFFRNCVGLNNLYEILLPPFMKITQSFYFQTKYLNAGSNSRWLNFWSLFLSFFQEKCPFWPISEAALFF